MTTTSAENWDFAVLGALYALRSQATLPQVLNALESEQSERVTRNLRTIGTNAKLSRERHVRNVLSRLQRNGFVEKPNRGPYLLIPKGREHYLVQLKERSPNSPLLKRKLVIADVQIELLNEGGYLAACEAIQGCHAEGETVAEALANLEDVARILLELDREDGLELPDGLKNLRADSVLKAQVVIPLPG